MSIAAVGAEYVTGRHRVGCTIDKQDFGRVPQLHGEMIRECGGYSFGMWSIHVHDPSRDAGVQSWVARRGEKPKVEYRDRPDHLIH